MSTAKDGPARHFEVSNPADAMRRAEELARRVLRVPKKEICLHKDQNKRGRKAR